MPSLCLKFSESLEFNPDQTSAGLYVKCASLTTDGIGVAVDAVIS
ncbi:hypothetical protein Poly51_24210 [Rubripirellula tenax]|uniref:Uncharacterized protein n=1 Tax=Rubripirellula tenax TaxID=2528015 RepID=A0A5C6F7E0_9BACT|nr:hypothetical protein Poly51_24210 [Rubripirellula tenax]